MCNSTSCFPLTPADVGATLLVKNTFVNFVSTQEPPAAARRSQSFGVVNMYKSDKQLTQAPHDVLVGPGTLNTATERRREPARHPHSSSQLPPDVVTLMIRRVPRRYTQEELKSEIENAGFDGCFDVFYLPMDERHKRNRGFAFVNFVDSSFAAHFQKMFHDQHLKTHQAGHPLDVVASELQGFDAMSQHFGVQRTNGKGSHGGPWMPPSLPGRPLAFHRRQLRPLACASAQS
jgi:hypothetical protein